MFALLFKQTCHSSSLESISLVSPPSKMPNACVPCIEVFPFPIHTDVFPGRSDMARGLRQMCCWAVSRG